MCRGQGGSYCIFSENRYGGRFVVHLRVAQGFPGCKRFRCRNSTGWGCLIRTAAKRRQTWDAANLADDRQQTVPVQLTMDNFLLFGSTTRRPTPLSWSFAKWRSGHQYAKPFYPTSKQFFIRREEAIPQIPAQYVRKP